MRRVGLGVMYMNVLDLVHLKLPATKPSDFCTSFDLLASEGETMYSTCTVWVSNTPEPVLSDHLSEITCH